MQELNDKMQLLDLIRQGAIVISPNNRLSASLLQSYYAHCKQTTVIKPKCMPYKQLLLTWFEKLRYNHSTSHPYLLNEAQCRFIWQGIIQKTLDITYSEGLLKAVMQAWKHCEQWQVPIDNPHFTYTPQTQRFQSWWKLFHKQLSEIQALSEYQLVPYLIKTQVSLCEETTIWLCFDEFTPEQNALQTHLTAHGVQQYRYDLADKNSQPELYAAENSKDEYEQLIHWLKLNLQEGMQRIGLVVPELQQEAQSLKRLLTQHFDSSLFNLSLGEPLTDYPLVAHALTWLSLEQKISSQQADLLLQTPYLAAAKEEFLSRAQFLQDSSLLQQSEINLKQFTQKLSSYAPKIADLLNNLIAYPSSASAYEWINLFHQRLNHLGFPGDLGLNSLQYQCYQRFISLFDEFRELALVKDEFTKNEALQTLTQLAANAIFQAQKTNAVIQISGLLEASGCEFDSLWVMGLSDQCIPAGVQLSAFIPPQLQRELYMPHSTAARELYFARQTLQRLQRGSRSVVFSYTHLSGDKPNLPSALISHFPPYTSFASNKISLKSFITRSAECYSLPLIENEFLSGGTALLANQAKCPFKAFAEHRLKAKPLLKTLEGIDSKERGKTIHKVMELLWHDLKSQTQLFTCTPEELDRLIDKSINEALRDQSIDSPVVQELEFFRLKRLVLSYLNWEKQRPPFVIAALEQSYSLNLAGLEIKLRVDRLDKVEDKTWVIDYKSTLPSSKPWNEERPQEQQLLLYALLNEEINTLVLIQIKTGKILCSGFSETKSEIKGISSLKKEEKWDDVRGYWRQQLNGLAQEALDGHCPPQPLNTSVCTYCDFKNLCRIDH